VAAQLWGVVPMHCAGMLTPQEVEEECVLPRVSRLPEVTKALAAAVARAGW
jgi:hypothetical protein